VFIDDDEEAAEGDEHQPSGKVRRVYQMTIESSTGDILRRPP
jgi:uncharacterized protein YjbJ (UPF0337 family)